MCHLLVCLGCFLSRWLTLGLKLSSLVDNVHDQHSVTIRESQDKRSHVQCDIGELVAGCRCASTHRESNVKVLNKSKRGILSLIHFAQEHSNAIDDQRHGLLLRDDNLVSGENDGIRRGNGSVRQQDDLWRYDSNTVV
jgi:hypothetical protein